MNIEKEIWKDIKGYEGIYQVSNLGRVKGLKKIVNVGLSNIDNRIKKEKILKGTIRSKNYNYLVCRLSNKCITKMYSIHRLVAETFIANPENKPCVNHKNGITTDNKLENLEWVTVKENTIHAWKTGLCKPHCTKQIEQHSLKVGE